MINLGIQVMWFLWFAFAHDWMQTVYGKWFHLSREQFDAIHYGGRTIFKIGIWLFNLVPMLVLYIIG